MRILKLVAYYIHVDVVQQVGDINTHVEESLDMGMSVAWPNLDNRMDKRTTLAMVAQSASCAWEAPGESHPHCNFAKNHIDVTYDCPSGEKIDA